MTEAEENKKLYNAKYLTEFLVFLHFVVFGIIILIDYLVFNLMFSEYRSSGDTLLAVALTLNFAYFFFYVPKLLKIQKRIDDLEKQIEKVKDKNEN